MVLPAVGSAISLSNLRSEYGGATPDSLSEYYAAGLYVPKGTSTVPESGGISLSQFRGKRISTNYINTGVLDVYYKGGIIGTQYGWYPGSFGSINNSYVIYQEAVDKYNNPISYGRTWQYCYWYQGTLYIALTGDYRSSGPDYFRVGNTITARTSFSRSYTGGSTNRTTMTVSMANNPFPTTANYRCRVSNYYTSVGEPYD